MPEQAIDEQVEHGLAGIEGNYIYKKKKKYISVESLFKDFMEK